MNRIEPPPPQHKRLARSALAAAEHTRRTRGSPASPSPPASRIGPVFGTTEPEAVITRHKIQASDIAAEGARLEAAIVQSRKQLAKLRAKLAVLPEESQAEIAPLIDAYIRMLGPSRLIRGVRQRIEETLLSAESAVMAEAESIADAIMAQAEPDLSAEDRPACSAGRMRSVRSRRRLVRNLTRSPFRSFAGLPEGAILVAESAAPGRCGAARSVAPGRRRHRGRRRRRPYRRDAAGAGRAGGAGRGRARARDAAGRHRRGGRHRPAGDAQSRAPRRWPPRETRGDGLRAGAAALCPAAPAAGGNPDGEPVELQANLELPIELPLIVQSGAVGNWSAANRVPVHEP